MLISRLALGAWIGLLLAACGAPDGGQRQAPPDKLSAWGLFSWTPASLTPADGTRVYRLNSVLFSDYAHKLRTLRIPDGQSMAVGEDGDSLVFPEGTVITKTFFYPRAQEGLLAVTDRGQFLQEDGSLDLASVHLVETRLLVLEAGGWQALPYVWNDAQTEALYSPTGEIVPTLAHHAAMGEVSFNYLVPDQNQCAGCHAKGESATTLLPLGPSLANLNLGNQLAPWRQDGLLEDKATHLRAMIDWRSEAAPTEGRARSYLNMNCGNCHNPLGPADTSGLYLDLATIDPIRLGRCKPPIAAGQGTGGHSYSIVPGKPDESILVFRMVTTDPGAMMPEIGRSLAHLEGISLVSDWIAAMPEGC